MHELGIVVHISKTLEELAQENNITDIRRVTLQIGKVSGIVPEYLVDCWQYYKKKVPLIDNSTLEYEWIEAITICNECKKTYDGPFHFRIHISGNLTAGGKYNL